MELSVRKKAAICWRRSTLAVVHRAVRPSTSSRTSSLRPGTRFQALLITPTDMALFGSRPKISLLPFRYMADIWQWLKRPSR
ncbi:MAG: hypothetical protein C0605_00795 [Hyphomicrobiales bacterium]|nr:MAG: hypothetical protein C0605_00795 [Hyphomicrobiales bacterium]